MIAPTHAIYGPALALIILAVFGVEASFHWTIVFCAILGSLAPDLDHPTSTIGRLFPWISKPLERRFGHRSITHSALGTVVATLGFAIIASLAALVSQWVLTHAIPTQLIPLSLTILKITPIEIARLTAAFAIGYASHIVLDMLTPRGVQLLWPNPNRDIWFKNSLQIETASKGEVPVALLGLVLLALAFPLSQYGPMTALRWFLATPEAAIAEYKNSPTATIVEFEGVWSATKQPIKGTAEILDVQNKRLVVALRSPNPQQASSSPLPIPANRLHSGLHLRDADPAKRNPNDPGLRTSGSGHFPPPNSNSMSDPSSSHRSDIAAPHLDSSPTRVNDSPRKSLGSASVYLPGAPPYSNTSANHGKWICVVTLSDELTADITTKKVHLFKSDHQVKIDKYQFDKQTRDQLLKRIPDDVLVSGIVYLPKNLKLTLTHAINSDSAGITQLNSKNSDSQWHAIEQVGNELRLHYATSQQLAEIGFDESFYAAQKQALQQQTKLKIRLNQLESKRHKIEFPADGLTPLGRQMLSNSESDTQRREKLEQIDQQIEALQGQLDEVNQLRSESELLFSGWVNIRLNGIK